MRRILRCTVLQFYLAAYNQLLGLGWLAVLLRIVSNFAIDGPASFQYTWSDCGLGVVALQTIVLLDVPHACCGLWPHEPAVSLSQRLWCKVGHRSELLVTMALIGAQNRQHWSAGPLILTWAMADVSRYQLYFLRSLNKHPPKWLSWLRYSDFLVQYPLNVVSEALFVYYALPGLLQNGYGWVSYAPAAVAFQVYEWIIFIPAFQTLWHIRCKRLHMASNSEAWRMPDRNCIPASTLSKQLPKQKFPIGKAKPDG